MRFFLASLLIFFTALLPPPLQAQNVQSPGAVPAPVVASEDLLDTTQPNLTYNDLDAYMSGIAQQAVSTHTTAGIAVIIVKDDEILHSRFYGQSRFGDTGQDTRSTALMRLGDLSKSYTSLALIQLIESGAISLNDPINQHLPKSLNIFGDGQSETIRVKHLLNGRHGWENPGPMAQNGTVPTLYEYLQHERPQPIHQPGRMANINDYATAAIGAIIAEKHGLPFEAAMEESLFTPLDLRNTTYREPISDGRITALPMEDKDRFAQAALWNGQNWAPLPFLHKSHKAPAASIAASLDDVALYLRALLKFEGNGDKILPQDAWKRLSTESEDLGFSKYQFGDLYGFGQRSEGLGFSSQFIVFRDQGLALFTFTNGGENSVIDTIPQLILKRYFPSTSKDNPIISSSNTTGVEGFYKTTNRPYSGVRMAVSNILGLSYMSVEQQGRLYERRLARAQTWTAIDDGRYRDSNTGRTLTLERQGNTVAGFQRDKPFAYFKKLSPLENPVIALAALVTLALTSAFLVALKLKSLVLRQADISDHIWSDRAVIAGAVSWLIYSCLLFTLIITLHRAAAEHDLAGPATLMRLILISGITAMTLSLIASASLWSVWKKKVWSAQKRFSHSIIVILWLLALYPLVSWGFIAFKI